MNHCSGGGKTLDSIECEKVIINTHYLAEQVNVFLDKYQQDNLDMSVIRDHEIELKGTAGTLMANLDYFNSCTGLLIHADNVTSNIWSHYLMHIGTDKKDAL